MFDCGFIGAGLSCGDLFLVAVRWIHVAASAAWIGGGLFYLMVLRPAVRKSGESGGRVNALAAAEFRTLVDICFFLLLVTGISMTFDRLSGGVVGVQYAGLLGIKAALSVLMFVLARRRARNALLERYRERPPPPVGKLAKALRTASGYNLVLILGLTVILIADLLNALYESALR